MPRRSSCSNAASPGWSALDPELVGRDLELARIDALLGEAAGRTLVLRGPGGIGKSALCRATVDAARRAGWVTVIAVAADVGEPYAPLAAVVEELAADDAALLERVGLRARSVLGRLASLPAGGEAPTEQVPLTRHSVTGALGRLLRAAGGGAPVLLVIDDAHLADEATIDVLGASRRRERRPGTDGPRLPAGTRTAGARAGRRAARTLRARHAARPATAGARRGRRARRREHRRAPRQRHARAHLRARAGQPVPDARARPQRSSGRPGAGADVSRRGHCALPRPRRGHARNPASARAGRRQPRPGRNRRADRAARGAGLRACSTAR